MQQLVFIGVGGALGSLSRFGLAKLFARLAPGALPWGTFVANVLGCFLLGLVATLALTSGAFPKAWKAPITTGFLGALTTFSTFTYETVRLVEDGSPGLAVINLLGNLAVGGTAVVLGMMLARAVVS